MTALSQDLDRYLLDYNYDRAHTGASRKAACRQTSSTARARPAPDDDASLSPQLRLRTD